MSDLAAKSVLLVEDDDADVELTRRAFEHYGFDVRLETAPDGAAALERLRAGPRPDLLVTDLKMPRLNGLELQQRMIEEPALKGLPVVVLTSSSERGDRETALGRGARAFLQKPMQLDDWRAVIETLKGVLHSG